MDISGIITKLVSITMRYDNYSGEVIIMSIFFKSK